ncbi:bifunctional hydroxymethylpyrimidine kinase/phosphomethylpyrimidine kinase [bacterium]|nr:bifunctional hydroxymethylpyrimidine kinase/phosphomethylpyrimidine kinase [bacterium]
MNNIDQLQGLIRGLSRARIAVIGDMIADEYLFCETARVSREAPVLIVNYLNNTFGLGGALNVVNNLNSLGAQVFPIGLLGQDGPGDTVLEKLRQNGISTDGLVSQTGFHTIAKTRILACSLHTTMQQVLRIDRGEQLELNNEAALNLEKRAIELLDTFDTVILSDYGYGSLTDGLLDHLRTRVAQKKMTVICDSRYALPRFHGLTAITPNVPEVQQVVGYRLEPTERLVRAGRQLLEHLQLDCVLVTRGKLGMALFARAEQERIVPVFGGDEVADVTGAGDTVIATFTAARAVGASYYQATLLANVAGGLVVMKRGAATVSAHELSTAAAHLETEDM